jgi:hypothetical protein
MTAAEFTESQRLQARWASATPTQRALYIAQTRQRVRQPMSDKSIDRVWLGLFWIFMLGCVPLLFWSLSVLFAAPPSVAFLVLIVCVILWK